MGTVQARSEFTLVEMYHTTLITHNPRQLTTSTQTQHCCCPALLQRVQLTYPQQPAPDALCHSRPRVLPTGVSLHVINPLHQVRFQRGGHHMLKVRGSGGIPKLHTLGNIQSILGGQPRELVQGFPHRHIVETCFDVNSRPNLHTSQRLKTLQAVRQVVSRCKRAVVQRNHVGASAKFLTALPLCHQHHVAHYLRVHLYVAVHLSVHSSAALVSHVRFKPLASLWRIHQRLAQVAGLSISQLEHKRLVTHVSQRTPHCKAKL